MFSGTISRLFGWEGGVEKMKGEGGKKGFDIKSPPPKSLKNMVVVVCQVLSQKTLFFFWGVFSSSFSLAI